MSAFRYGAGRSMSCQPALRIWADWLVERLCTDTWFYMAAISLSISSLHLSSIYRLCRRDCRISKRWGAAMRWRVILMVGRLCRRLRRPARMRRRPDVPL